MQLILQSTVSYNMTKIKHVLILSALVTFVQAKGPRPSELGASSLEVGAESVVWYATWETATAEAKRSNKPIFFMAAAHQCGSVSGTF